MSKPQEILTKIVEMLAAVESKGMSLAISISDESGIATTVRRSNALEEAQPGHLERQLVVLNAMYYDRYCKEEMHPTSIVVDTGKTIN